MINILCSRICILTCGTLYPCYMSFKTVRAKHAADYLKWMMYWIVFAIFTVSETFTDIFLSWLPFYYEFKVLFILWIAPTVGNGSSYIYENFVHPLLQRHESRVDQHLAQVKEKGQDIVLHYMKEAILYIGRGIMNIINNNFPHGICGFLANNSISNSAGIIQRSSNVFIKEEEVQHVPKLTNVHQNVTSNVDDNTPQSSRGRSRKTRRTKQVDYNSNKN